MEGESWGYAGASGTVLKLANSTNKELIKCNVGSTTVMDNSFRNLVFDGNRTNQTTAKDVIHFEKTSRMHIDHCMIKESERNGLYVLGTARGIHVNQLEVNGCDANGVYMAGVQAHLNDVWSQANTESGIVIATASGLETEDTIITNALCGSNTDFGIYLYGSSAGTYRDVSILGGQAGDNGKDGLLISADSNDLKKLNVIGLKCAGNSTTTADRDGIRIDAGASGTITDLDVMGCHSWDYNGTKAQAYGLKIINGGNITGIRIIGGSYVAADNKTGNITYDAKPTSYVVFEARDVTNDPATAGGGGAAHDLLDGSTIQDSVAQAVTRGSLIYGDSTPKWNELVIGAANTYLKSDGTDAAWAAAPTRKSMWAATMRALTLNFGTTYYYNFDQSGALQTSENQCWVYVPFACTLKNFYVYVITNTLDGNLVCTVRQNGADTSPAITTTHGATVTGVQSDTSNSDTFAAGDYVTVDFDTTAASSGSVKIGSISCECDPT